MNKLLIEEAEAFDKRIVERTKNGFIPDLRNSVSCEYFYKSFWREPHYIKLYMGTIIETTLEYLNKYSSAQAKILDVGCGNGLISLELARHGYHVDAIDISSENIQIAKETLKNNQYTDNFGSLNYQNKAFEDIEGEYDIINFSGSLHHMLNLNSSIKKAYSLLNNNGILCCNEPYHEKFKKSDAAQVALIRGLLSLTDVWFDKQEIDFEFNQIQFDQYIEDIHQEYILERDKDEPLGQSPNDLESDGKEILEELSKSFTQLEVKPVASFIYRLLGGLRGEKEKIYKIADFLTLYDNYMINEGFMGENGFHYVGEKSDLSIL